MEKESTKVNYLYNLIYQATLVVFPVITIPYLTRTLGPINLGEYAYAYSIAYLFYCLSLLGINFYGNRTIAGVRDKTNKLNYTFSRIYFFQLINSALILILYFISIHFFIEGNKRIFYILGVLVASAMLDINWAFFGLEKFKVVVIRRIIIKILTLIGFFSLVHKPSDIYIYTVLIVISEVLGNLYTWMYISKYIKVVQVRFNDIFMNLKEIYILFIPIIATTVYRYMDKFLLGVLGGTASQIGQLDYSEKMIMVCLGLVTALGNTMLPRMAYLLAKNDKSIVNEIIEISMQIVIIISSLLSFGIYAVADQFVYLYFGPDYKLSGEILKILTLTIIPIAWTSVIRQQYLIPASRDKIYIISVITGVVVNLILSFILIPIYSLFGVLIALTVTEYLVMIIQTVFVFRELPIWNCIRSNYIYIISGYIMFELIRYYGVEQSYTWSNLTVKVIIGLFIYIVLTILFSYLFKNKIYNYIRLKIIK